MNADVKNDYPAAVSGAGARLWLLFRKDAWDWIQLGLLASLVCLVATEGIGRLILLVVSKMAKPGEKPIESPLLMLIIIWIMVAMAMIPAFAAGSFADLARPAALTRWLLLPARLWEKLWVRWLSSTMVFYATGLACFSVWLIIHNGGVDFSGLIKEISKISSKEMARGILEFLGFFSGVHALGFFIGSTIRRPVWSAAIFYGLLLVLVIVHSIMFRGQPLNVMFYSFIIFWPLTWVVLKRSRA
jgi:hypothetical protein